jgi:signal transduction histidine kinase
MNDQRLAQQSCIAGGLGPQPKEEFIAVLSHEMRTPLHSVLGWVQLLQRDIAVELRPRALQAIERNARAMARIIDDLAERSRITSGKLCLRMEPIDIGDIVREAAARIRPLAEARGLTLHCHVPASPTTLQGDAGRLLQVVSNLLSNATKFTPAGGHVGVDVASEEESVCIRVTDTGRGIDAALLPRLFEPFQQGEDNSARQQGLGLGLALVKEFVERHGGKVRARSEGRGQGATFIVLLPKRPPAG